MKSLLLILGLSLVMLVTAQDEGDETPPAQDEEAEYIENQYLLALDEALVRSDADVEDVIERLEEFDIVFIDRADMNDLMKILLVNSSDETNVQNATDALPEVKFYERNMLYTLEGDDCCCQEVGAPQSWGLDRIDQRDLLDSNNPVNLDATYLQSQYKGAGVVSYIVDSGIDTFNPQFGGRAIWGFSIGGFFDSTGHGTLVAGVVGSRLYGVSKETTLVAVRVFNFGPTSTFNIIRGLTWVFFDHLNRLLQSGGVRPKSVVNMSFEGPPNRCMDGVINALISVGINAVAAAGNRRQDACDVSPARGRNVVTVAASTVRDDPAFFTNFGRCVNIFAPGVDVTTTARFRRTQVVSGTSFSAPFVTGAIALKLSELEVALPPEEIADWLRKRSTKKRLNLTDVHGSSPNRLLYVDCER